MSVNILMRHNFDLTKQISTVYLNQILLIQGDELKSFSLRNSYQGIRCRLVPEKTISLVNFFIRGRLTHSVLREKDQNTLLMEDL